MEWARGSHPEAGGNCAWRENRHIHSPGWQSLSNAAGLLGSGGRRYSVFDCVQELRGGDPVIEVLGADNPSLVTAVREGKPNPKERKDPDHIELVSMTIK